MTDRRLKPGDTYHDLGELSGKFLDGTTLTPLDAMRHAAKWWDSTGRKIISKIFNVEEVGGSFRPAAKGAPAIKVSPNREVVIPSKVLQGHAWDELDRRERAAVVKAWLSQYRQVYSPKRDSRIEIVKRLQ